MTFAVETTKQQLRSIQSRERVKRKLSTVDFFPAIQVFINSLCTVHSVTATMLSAVLTLATTTRLESMAITRALARHFN